MLDEIDAVGIDPKRITLEITETALLADHDAVAARLAILREAGIQIAIDDFGTGYANLGYLTALPLDMLKIDRGLVANIVMREHDRIVVKALIRLARDLDLKVVVEGVETAEQLALLKDWGCDVYQGFLASPALTEAELMRFARPLRLSRNQLLLGSGGSDPSEAAGQLYGAIEARIGGQPVARDAHLAVRSQLRRAFQAIDIVERPAKIRKSGLCEGNHRAFGPKVELSDHRVAAIELYLDDLHQVRGFLGERAEAVDQLGRERVNRLPVLKLAESAVEAHPQIEVGNIFLGDHDRRIHADLRREILLSKRRRPLSARRSRPRASIGKARTQLP